MSGRLAGKVAFITGAGRGQGRSHALRLAQEGADIIAVDICRDIPSNPYPMASPEDLAETERLVKETGRQILAAQADVRERSELAAVIEQAVGTFGRLDVVAANAGILPMAVGRAPGVLDFQDAVDVDLVGVMNAVAVSLPHLQSFGSIVLTGSTAGMMDNTTSNPELGGGGAGYGWSKRVLIEYTEQLALQVAPQFIRVNCIHPTNVNTMLLHNEGLYNVFRPDMAPGTQTEADVEPAFMMFQAMPIPYIEPVDVSNLVLFLASDEARYVTGQNIRVDAGSLLKWPNGPTG
jgi:SDR family mycofactocin-dependent oxidoreductase